MKYFTKLAMSAVNLKHPHLKKRMVRDGKSWKDTVLNFADELETLGVGAKESRAVESVNKLKSFKPELDYAHRQEASYLKNLERGIPESKARQWLEDKTTLVHKAYKSDGSGHKIQLSFVRDTAELRGFKPKGPRSFTILSPQPQKFHEGNARDITGKLNALLGK